MERPIWLAEFINLHKHADRFIEENRKEIEEKCRKYIVTDYIGNFGPAISCNVSAVSLVVDDGQICIHCYWDESWKYNYESGKYDVPIEILWDNSIIKNLEIRRRQEITDRENKILSKQKEEEIKRLQQLREKYPNV